MTKKEFFDQYKDPKWQKKRLEIMKRDKFVCQICGDNKTALNVHHKYYTNGKEPWQYSNEDLITLCECCHVFAEKNKKIFGFNACHDIDGSILKSKDPKIKLRLYKFLELSLIYIFNENNKAI